MQVKLTLKEEAFIRETLGTLNPTEAVRRVYNLGSKGGSKNLKQLNQTARAMACENLAKPHIRLKIVELSERFRIDKNSRLVRLADIFYSNDTRSVLVANDQITKILGEYAPTKQEIDDIRENRRDIFKVQ